MAKLTNIEYLGGRDLSLDLTDNFDAWVSDTYYLESHNQLGVFTMQFNTTGAAGAKVKFEQSLDGVKWDKIRDCLDTVIEVTLNETCTVPNMVNLYAPMFRIIGSVTGSAGTLDEILILNK